MITLPDSLFAARRRPLLHIGLLAIHGLWGAVALAQEPLERLDAAVPTAAADCVAERNEQLAEVADALEEWAAATTWRDWTGAPAAGLQSLEQLIAAKQHVDRRLDKLLDLRTQFVRLAPGAARREQIRQYLRATSQLIDLSGRLRYLLRDAVDNVAYAVEPEIAQYDRLLDILTEQRVSIGASVVTYALFDPPPDSSLLPFPLTTKVKALRLLAAAGQADVLPDLADFLRQEATPTELLILAAEAVREIGLPQDERPGQDPSLPAPAITARQLYSVLAGRTPPADLAQRHQQLLAWLDERSRRGVVDESFRLGGSELLPGDWLLMRNPSPYNLFTDLSPGLFTHVGVVGVETDEGGVRRFVIVDLPERGDRIPATNADIYLERTVHYFFVRHRDPQVGGKMGQVASSLVGNQSQFDLTFRTSRVEPLRGKLTSQTRIHTYCAGFLLLCAQETTAPREEFFPLPEFPAGGNCQQNLAKLGLSIGVDFVSPTGALFSPHLEIVARREPMYSPGREIKENIYDAFARAMIDQELTPSPDAFQALRETLARLSKYNPWLARALARANDVSEHLDLEAAAKAAAVIETLDEIADRNRDEFFGAREALLAGPLDELQASGAAAGTVAQTRAYRQQHAALFRRWSQGELTPRQLRLALVDHYSRQGVGQLRRRFFGEPE